MRPCLENKSSEAKSLGLQSLSGSCTGCLGTGVFSLVPEQGHHVRPLLPLQNGYINFDKRRKVSRLGLDAGLLCPCPRKGKGEANSGVPEFWLLQFEGSFPGVCCPF